MKKNLIIGILSLLLLAAIILIYKGKPVPIEDMNIVEEPVEIALDSTMMAEIYKDYPVEKANGDVIIMQANVRRICYRDVMNRAWGTYYPVAKSFWRDSQKPFNCKYIRIEHSIYGAKKQENTSQVGHIPQQSRHCRAHHLKAWFSPFGLREYFVEIGQN